MSNMPCKDCLVLAACKNRAFINCTKLFKWRWDRRFDRGELDKMIPNWREIVIANTDIVLNRYRHFKNANKGPGGYKK